MHSMTGYGRASAAFGSSTLTVQVSSVNRKTLDLTISLPEAWESLEPRIGEAVRRHASRGKVHVDVELSGRDGAPQFHWDDKMAAEILRQLREFATRQSIQFSPTTELLWQIASAQRKDGNTVTADEIAPVLWPALDEALKNFSAMRAQEGAALLQDFLSRLDQLKKHVSSIAERAPAVPKNYREQLHQRLRQAGLDLDLNDERVLKEIALFAERCDIAEELTRLASHFEQFNQLLQGGGEIGRKAEFILQEIGREVHTIGSKANDLVISRAVIELKNELERVREQVANVE